MHTLMAHRHGRENYPFPILGRKGYAPVGDCATYLKWQMCGIMVWLNGQSCLFLEDGNVEITFNSPYAVQVFKIG